jgi:isopenicillin N synthase-like dioxygenase
MSALSAKTVDAISLPLIDVSGLRSADPAQRQTVGRQLRAACADKGFFYITNHGISPELVARTFAASETFFALPEPEKLRLDKANSPFHRGYERMRGQTLETGAPPDLKEGMYLGKELALDDPRSAGSFNQGPNQWPASLPRFRPAMEAYMAEMNELAQVLMRGLALSLNLGENYFADFCLETTGTLRLLDYPPQPANPMPNEKGCGAHTDFGTITLLAQDDVGGLQVYDAQHGWIHAPPIPNTFVVNLGDLTQRWTNDLYHSTLHRVVNLTGRERYSLPFFFTGKSNYEVTCLPGCVAPEETPKYPPITVGQHYEECYRRTYI